MQSTNNNLFQEAISCYRQGALQKAESLCARLLEKEPNDANGLNLLGLIAQARNQHEKAIRCFVKASQINPTECSYYENIVMSYHATKRISLAINALEKILALDSGNTEALFNLALISQQKPEKAMAYLDRLLAIEPRNVAAVNQLISHFLAIGSSDKALALAQQSVVVITTDAALYYNLALLLHKTKSKEAIVAYNEAIRCRPEFVNAHINVASLYLQKNKIKKAIVHYKSATELQPESKDNWRNYCIAYQREGQNSDALMAIRCALKLSPNDEDCLTVLSQCLLQLSALPITYDDDLIRDYLACLNSKNKVVDNLLRIGEGILNDALNRIFSADHLIDGVLVNTLSKKCVGEDWQWSQLNTPAIINTLKELPLRGLRAERLLTSLRRVMVEAVYAQEKNTKNSPVVFLAALAEQCFYNEYIYSQTSIEDKIIREIECGIETNIKQGVSPDASKLALLACYKPLFDLENAQWLLESSFLQDNALLDSLLTKQIREPLIEDKIKPSIPRLFHIKDETSKKVQQQYERNPYPRWRRYIKAPVMGFQSFIAQEIPGLPPLPIENHRPEILVAGCGTGKETIGMAKRFPEANITAVDLSQSSLAYAIRKARELKITNISWAQTDLLMLGEWHRRFDMINSAGVLHHLKNPLQGWQVITKLLKPGGVMNIGLYSKTARHSIIAARLFIKDNGYSSTVEGIRRCRQDLIALPNNHPAKKCIQYGDFFTLSDCRDLLFHVQEHCYTVPKIKEELQVLGLEFLKFHVDAGIKEDFSSLYAHHTLGRNESLDLWHQFEMDKPETFLTMYQFWLYKAAA